MKRVYRVAHDELISKGKSLFKNIASHPHLHYLLLRLFPKWLYTFSTKVRIPKTKVDFCKLLIARYALQSGGSAIDVGAHVGYHTRYLADVMAEGGVLWSFEPNPYIFKLLEKYVSGKPNIRAAQKAVSNRSSQILSFYVSPYSLEQDSTLELDRKHKRHKKIEVETTTLDDLLSQGLDNLKFIKIDVEGHERKVLEGAQKVIEQFRPYIVFEYSLQAALDAHSSPLSFILASDYLCIDLQSLHPLSREDLTDLTDVLAFPRERELEIQPLINCLRLL